MKKARICMWIIFILLYAVGCSENSNPTNTDSQPDFKILNSGVTVDLYDVDFSDSNNGFIVGDSGTVLKTTDGGDSWEAIKLEIDLPLYCVKLLNKNDIFIGGPKIILKSNNGGEIWSNTNVYGNIFDIFFNSNKIGYAIGGYYITNSTLGVIYRTENKGEEWLSPLKKDILGLFASCIIFDTKVYILSVSSCMNLGLCDMNIYKTIDGGKNFKSTYKSSDKGIYSLFNIDSTSIFAVGQKGIILYSSDKGENWISRDADTEEDLFSIFGISKDEYYVCGASGVILTTNNKGQSWVKQNSGTNKKLNSIYFPSSSYGIAVGENGTIIKIQLD